MEKRPSDRAPAIEKCVGDPSGRPLKDHPYRCVSCGVCHGSGEVEVATDGYPEWELETCDECDGYGTVETCAWCALLAELEHDDDAF